MSGDVTPYISLVSSEHADKSNYMAMIAVSCQPSADVTALYKTIPVLFDVDLAVGQQLDVIGQWVGVSRQLTTALVGVYFAFDTTNVGFDQGVWQGPTDPSTGLVTLPDTYYRILIKVRILNNQWDGSKPMAYTLMNAIFGPLGYSIYIEDNANLTMNLGLVTAGPQSAIALALLTSGKFNIKPATIRIAYYINQSVAGPIFGFDINNSLIAGFDTGGWGSLTAN
jgi:hypothetical protein